MTSRHNAVVDLIPVEERLRSALANRCPDIGVLWEFCAYFEWRDRAATVDSISRWLGEPDGLRILDCACGSGFPAIELARRGYDITCSDGSAAMLAHFRRNVAREGLAIESAQVRWEQLAASYRSSFDVVMCRGASFPYAGTWDNDSPPSRAALTASMEQFVAALRPGGRLYVDTIHAADLMRGESRPVRHPRLRVDGHTVDLEEQVVNHPERGIRVWHSRMTVDGTTYEFERRSHQLWPHELAGLLTGAGLADVRRETVPGERYQVYSGRSPASRCY